MLLECFFSHNGQLEFTVIAVKHLVFSAVEIRYLIIDALLFFVKYSTVVESITANHY